MIDIGVARPSAQGQAMISTATALMSAWASRGWGPTMAQIANVMIATVINDRHEVAGHHVRELLNRRAAALGFAHHLHDAREQGVRADSLGPHDERAGRIHGGADHPIARVLFDRELVRR